ncbi:MAG: MFS transporter [Planctomycetes bacterium]|nr:MFS transporter [Planctomycetota bacterium]MCB9868738.1 MFS transporter [Planctomycetota bacterium]MCB9888750.1 MFS transporter [Planctomycetota bacterium]
MLRAFRSLAHSVYGGLPAITWLICLAAFVNRAGSMILPFLSLYLGKRFGYDVEQAGYLVAMYGIGSVAGSIVGGRLSDLLGPVRVQLVTLLGAAAWMLLLTQLENAWSLALGILVLGLINDAFRPGNMASVLASVPPELGPTALTLNRVAVNAGWAIGPTIGGHLAEIDFRWLFVADGGTCALAALVLWAFVPRDLAHDIHPASAGETARQDSPWRDGRFLCLLAVTVLTLLAFMQYFSTETRYLAAAFGLTEGDIGWLLAINPVLIVLVEMPLVRALRGRPRLPLVALGTLLIALSFPLLVPVRWGLSGVIAQLLLLTVGEMLSFSLLNSFVGDRAPPRLRGQYLGVHGASFAVAFVLAPALGGRVYERLGADVLWYGCAGLAGLAALGYLWLNRLYGRTREAPPRAD